MGAGGDQNPTGKLLCYVPQSVTISIVDEFFAPIHWSDQFASDARIVVGESCWCECYFGRTQVQTYPVMIHQVYTQQGVFYVRTGFEHLVQQSIEQSIWWTKSKRQKLLVIGWQIMEAFCRKLLEQLKALCPFDDEGFGP
jgi:assimilatory nitrate reductase catalytic subunit